MGERALDKRRSSAGTDAHHHIASVYPSFIERQGPGSRLVFGAFHASMQCTRSSGDNPLNQIRISSKCWRDLTGIENAQTATAAGSDVKQTSPSLQRGPYDLSPLRQTVDSSA